MREQQFCSKPSPLAISRKPPGGQVHVGLWHPCRSPVIKPYQNITLSLFTTPRLCLLSACRGVRICPACRQWNSHKWRTSSSKVRIPRTYLGLVGDVGQNTGDQAHVHKGQPGMARSPAEVLVAVGVEFCSSVSTASGESPRSNAWRVSRWISLGSLWHVVQSISSCPWSFGARGGLGSIGQSGEREAQISRQNSHLLGPAMVAVESGAKALVRCSRRLSGLGRSRRSPDQDALLSRD